MGEQNRFQFGTEIDAEQLLEVRNPHFYYRENPGLNTGLDGVCDHRM
jgi:hypothetical protein